MAKVVITGCSRGIGFELTKLFAEEGHEVLALSRSIGAIKALELKNVSSFSFDICKKEDLEKLETHLNTDTRPVDILINNAGKLLNKAFGESSLEDFKAVYDVNVFGVAELTRRLIPKMSENAHVINISSMGGVQGSLKFPGLAAYSSSKGALITLTELLAEEYKDSGPSFNVLALGAVQTEMLEEAFPGYKAPVTARDMAKYIKDFALNGHKVYNGKLLQVSSSTP